MFDKFFEFGRGGKETHAKDVILSLSALLPVSRSDASREALDVMNEKGIKLDLNEDEKKYYQEGLELLQSGNLSDDTKNNLKEVLTQIERDYNTK